MTEDSNQLTDKQKLAITVIAGAKSVNAGINVCAEEGIVTRDWCYRQWLKQPAFVEALQLERERVQGEIRTRIVNAVAVRAEDVIENLLNHACSSRGDSPRCAEIILSVLGFNVGKASQVNINANVSGKNEKQGSFDTRLQAAIQDRTVKLAEAEVVDDGATADDTTEDNS